MQASVVKDWVFEGITSHLLANRKDAPWSKVVSPWHKFATGSDTLPAAKAPPAASEAAEGDAAAVEAKSADEAQAEADLAKQLAE
jgi:hypothetical protein